MIDRFEQVRPSTKMWAAILGSVALYDLVARPGETLSENFHENIERGGLRRVAIVGGIWATAFHLVNGYRRVGLPDPFGVALGVIKHNSQERSRVIH